MENNRDLENLLVSFENIKSVIEAPVRERVTTTAAEKLPETNEERTLYRYMMSLRARRLLNAVDKDGKNPDGYYFNPETKEFDPNYNPLEDPRFRSTKAATDTVEQISRVEDLGLLQDNIDAMHEQISKNEALATNESMKNALEAEEAKRNAHIEAINQVIQIQERLIARTEHLQNYLEKQIALFTSEFTEFQTRFMGSSMEEKKKIKESGEGKAVVQNYARVRELDRQLAMIKTASDSAKRILDAWDPNNLECIEDVLDETYRTVRIIGDFKNKREADIVVRYNELTDSYDVYLRQFDAVSDDDIAKGVIPELHSDKLSIKASEFNAENLNKQISILRNKQKINELQDKITIITFPDGTVIPALGANIETVIDEKIRADHTKSRKNRKENKKNPTKAEPAKPVIPTTTEETHEPTILEGLVDGAVFKDLHNEYVFDAEATINAYLADGGEKNEDGLYKNPETKEFDKDYNPLNDPKYQTFNVYEVVEKLNPTATLDRYKAAGYDKDEKGVYFNPKTSEYDPAYNPLDDPMFQVKDQEKRKIGTIKGYELLNNADLTKVSAEEVVKTTEATPAITSEEPTKVAPPVVPGTPAPTVHSEREAVLNEMSAEAEYGRKPGETPVAPVITPDSGEVVDTPETPVVSEETPVVTRSEAPRRRTPLDRNRGDRLRLPYIINKLTDGVNAESMGTKASKKLKAQNISLSPKGLFNFREYDYAIQKLPKTIVGLITYLPVTLVKGVYKAVQSIRTTEQDEYSWELFRQHFYDLTDDEKGILFTYLQNSEVKRVGITDTEAVLLQDLVSQWAYSKVQELNKSNREITARVINDAQVYLNVYNELNNPDLDATRRAELEAQLGTIAAGKADLLLQREEQIELINKYINGGVQGFSQTMKDIVSHQSYSGQHFAKGLTFDDELNKAQSDAQLKLLNALESDSPTRDADAMLAFIEAEKIISDGTILDGKKQIGSREYEVDVKEMNHSQDTFYRDWIAALALAGQAFAVGREICNNINAGKVINESEAAQTYQTQVQQYGRELQGDAQQMYLGNQATNMELAGANHTYGEVNALVNGNFSFKSTVYRGLDDQLHTVIEPAQIQAIGNMRNITEQIARGDISLAEGLQRQAAICREQCTVLQNTCQSMQQPLATYLQGSGAKYEYGALIDSTNELANSAQLIASGQYAAADVARIATNLENFEFNLSAVPELAGAVSDYVPAIVSTASMLTLVGSIQSKINEKYMAGELSEEFAEALDSINAEDLIRAQARTR